EMPKPGRRGESRWDGQLDIPVELLAIVEKHEIGERLAQVAGWQEADVLFQIRGEYPDADLVLYAEYGPPQHRLLAEHLLGGGPPPGLFRPPRPPGPHRRIRRSPPEH